MVVSQSLKMRNQFMSVATIGFPKDIGFLAESSLTTTLTTMTRLKDQIRLAKAAIKLADVKPHLYTDEEIMYMRKQLGVAKQQLKEKQLRKKAQKGFDDDKKLFISACQFIGLLNETKESWSSIRRDKISISEAEISSMIEKISVGW